MFHVNKLNCIVVLFVTIGKFVGFDWLCIFNSLSLLKLLILWFNVLYMNCFISKIIFPPN